MNSSRASNTGLKLLALVLISGTLNACGNSEAESGASATAQLSSPSSISLSGTTITQVNGVTYVFATSTGTIDASGNEVTANFADPFVPLVLNSTTPFSAQMNTGSCSSLGSMVSSVVGEYSNQVQAQLSATGCTDLAQINILLDTTQVIDLQGYSGTDVVTISATVDLAPRVSIVATGNTASDGTGTTYATGGQFSIANDNSLVVTFSKDVSQGTLSGTLSECTATLGTPVIVSGTNGTEVAWPLTNASSMTSGGTCILNVAAVTDNLSNPEDPNDSNVNMTVTFE